MANGTGISWRTSPESPATLDSAKYRHSEIGDVAHMEEGVCIVEHMQELLFVWKDLESGCLPTVGMTGFASPQKI
jgi:hypothetical protein